MHRHIKHFFVVMYLWSFPLLSNSSQPTDTLPLCKTSKCQGSHFYVSSLSDADKGDMRNVIWNPKCPVPLEDLRNAHVAFLTDQGQIGTGRLIVHQSVAEEVVDIFREMLNQSFVLHQVDTAVVKNGNDDALMSANITTAFNCRAVTGGKGFSKHSWGTAIDINPLWNPYVKGKLVLPKTGLPYLKDRETSDKSGLLTPKSKVVELFERRGWKWGGRWRSLKDWQHFEKPNPKTVKNNHHGF